MTFKLELDYHDFNLIINAINYKKCNKGMYRYCIYSRIPTDITEGGILDTPLHVDAHHTRHGSTSGKNLLSIKYVAKCYGVIPCENT